MGRTSTIITQNTLMLPHRRSHSCPFSPVAVMPHFSHTDHQAFRDSSCGTTRHRVTALGRCRNYVKGGGVVPADSAWHRPPHNPNKPADTPHHTKGVSNKHTCASTTTTTTAAAAATTTDGVVVTLYPRPPPSPPCLLTTTTTTIQRHLYVLLLTALLLLVVQVPRVSCHLDRRDKRDLINDETVGAVG